MPPTETRTDLIDVQKIQKPMIPNGQEPVVEPPKPGSKEAILQTYGMIKDDPHWEKMLEEIYARRKADSE